MINIRTFILTLIIQTILFPGCSNPVKDNKGYILRSYSLDNLDGLITERGLELDNNVTSDGRGSLKIVADNPLVINLFETGDIDVDNSVLIYSSKLKSMDLDGEAYLEMWSIFKNKGMYFSRGLNSTVSGNTDWVDVKTPFILKSGENPDNIKLNLVINGKGTVWIDDIKLAKTTLDN